jgi:excisionase family DNA binding protein
VSNESLTRYPDYTVRRLAREGRIPAFKAGGQWRFDVKEIEEWKKAQRLNKRGK